MKAMEHNQVHIGTNWLYSSLATKYMPQVVAHNYGLANSNLSVTIKQSVDNSWAYDSLTSKPTRPHFNNA